MVDLRSKTHGPGATTGVNLVVLAYDDRVLVDEAGAVSTRYLDARLHPGDRRAPGETQPALVPRAGGRARSGYEHSVGYSARDFARIAAAAGENTAPLTDADGSVVGRAYGIRADLLVDDGAVVVNTKTVGPTELSVARDDAAGDIRARIAASAAAARSLRQVVATP